MYKFQLLILSLLISNLTYTQATFTESSDPEALELLKTISNNYLAQPAHKIAFTLDIELPGAAKESQQGQLIQAGEKFVLEMAGRKIISDSETVWMYLEDINEVQINDAEFDESEEFLSPSDIFSLYESNDYLFAISNYGNENGLATTQIEGKPLSEDSDYSKMRLTVTSSDNTVKRLKIFLKDGSRYTLQIDQHDPNFVTEKKTFVFDAAQYEGVHVEDLRF